MGQYSIGDQILCHIKENQIIYAYETKWEQAKSFEIIGTVEDEYIIYIPSFFFLKETFQIDYRNHKKFNIDKKFIDSSGFRISEYRIVGLYRKIDGMSCSRCKEFHQMVSSNNEDGTFTCFLCRTYKYR